MEVEAHDKVTNVKVERQAHDVQCKHKANGIDKIERILKEWQSCATRATQ
jgi:hypothetical protein